MRVLVCGGRDFVDADYIRSELNRLARCINIDCLIEGNAHGVDRIAGHWARQKKIDNLKFQADWKTHGKAAGPIRNQRMIEEGMPSLVVVFPGGRGTADMVARAHAADIPVEVIPEKEGKAA